MCLLKKSYCVNIQLWLLYKFYWFNVFAQYIPRILIDARGFSFDLSYYNRYFYPYNRSSRPEMFLGKDVLQIFSTFTGQHPCRSAISRNHTLAWVLSWIFAAYFQKPFPKNTAPSVHKMVKHTIKILQQMLKQMRQDFELVWGPFCWH